ncbi:MAG TPA: hypothetical protein PLB55_21760 [Prosthecobacter sp.]|nr:hypothetical protein [Prosthecobacter sp.]
MSAKDLAKLPAVDVKKMLLEKLQKEHGLSSIDSAAMAEKFYQHYKTLNVFPSEGTLNVSMRALLALWKPTSASLKP